MWNAANAYKPHQDGDKNKCQNRELTPERQQKRKEHHGYLDTTRGNGTHTLPFWTQCGTPERTAYGRKETLN